MDHGQGQLEKAEVDLSFPHAERHAYRDDMGDSYGAAYTTRSADEGYGEGYGEAVKAVMEKKAHKEALCKRCSEVPLARGPRLRTQVYPEYDRSQGHPIAELEHGRHATNRTAMQDEADGRARAAELGGSGGAAI